MTQIKLDTDFQDYYDGLLVNGATQGSVWKRKINGGHTRSELFELLHKMGVPTVEYGSVRGCREGQCVVYTDSRGHMGNGKSLMETTQARMIHPNSLCSVWHPEAGLVTYKVIQIGLKRYQLTMQGASPLKEGRVVNVLRLADSPEYPSLSPIYSIDYIRVGNGTQMSVVATDLNLTQPLGYLGFAGIMSAADVVQEIMNTFKRYGL